MRHMLLCWFLLVGTTVAQTVWNISPPSNLTQVFANAAPGDIVVLAPGNYSRFVLTKGLTVIGPATIRGLDSPPTPSTGPWNSAVQVPAGQHARLVGLDFVQGLNLGSTVYPNTPHGLEITGNASIEDCQIGPGDPTFTVTSGTVGVQRCTLRLGWAYGGAEIYGGVVSITDSTLFGRDCFDFVYGQVPGSPAVSVYGGAVTCTNVTARGGTGCQCAYCPSPAPSLPAIAVSTGTDVRISDSSLFAGLGSLPQSALTGDANTRVARSSLTPNGGGAPTLGGVVSDGNLVGLHMASGFVRGQTTNLVAIGGISQSLLVVAASFGMQFSVASPFSGALFLEPATLQVLGFGFPANGGNVTTSVAVPLGAALLGCSLWAQAAQLTGVGQWYASPMVGGVVR